MLPPLFPDSQPFYMKSKKVKMSQPYPKTGQTSPWCRNPKVYVDVGDRTGSFSGDKRDSPRQTVVEVGLLSGL